MRDFSFLKFENSITDAIRLSLDSPMASLRYYQAICLSPDEFYLQTTNTKTGIEFNGDYTAHLVDCNDVLVLDITNKVFISEFTDINGINQISFEIIPIKQDFSRRGLILKISHTASSMKWYSAPINVTNYRIQETTRFDYKHNGYFNGIDYKTSDKYQSIRLRTWFDRKVNDTEITNYYQISNQNTISLRPLRSQSEVYKTNYFNELSTDCADVLLLHDIIYVDGVRMTNKTVIDNTERVGQTNLREESEFSIKKDYNDTFTPFYQIFEPLELVNKIPFGTYSTGTLPASINMEFNKEISVLTGTVIIYDSSDVILASFNQNDVGISFGNTSIVDISALSFVNDEYTIKVSQGLFESEHGEISPAYEWVFTVVSGEYESTEYDNTEYLTV